MQTFENNNTYEVDLDMNNIISYCEARVNTDKKTHGGGVVSEHDTYLVKCVDTTL